MQKKETLLKKMLIMFLLCQLAVIFELFTQLLFD